ncbi:MAG: DUF3179 domain-containing (seleno)protein [Gammaproteobacteria bacterium]
MSISLVVDVIIFAIGTGALLTLYLPFSPMTIDMVNLRRETQISIYRNRRLFWVIGIVGLATIFLRGLYAMIEPAAAGSLFAASSPSWFWISAVTSLALAFMFWSGYVPFVMSPPQNPEVLSLQEGDRYLGDDDVVLGFEYEGQVRAYPRDSIARPHFFNDKIAGQNFTVSYCILCNSGIAFKSEINNQPIQLRCVTAYNNNILYYDPASDNFIQQLDGKVIDGPDTGKELTSYPVTIATWKEWKTLYPDTKLYYAPPATIRDKMVGMMLQMMIPIEKLAKRKKPWHRIRGKLDKREPAMSYVFGVEINGDSCAFTQRKLSQEKIINDTVGGEEITIFYDKERDIGKIYRRNLDGKILNFEPESRDGSGIVARDRETQSAWNLMGQAVDGQLKGKHLDAVPHFNKLFWFSWALFKPGTRIGLGDSDNNSVRA